MTIFFPASSDRVMVVSLVACAVKSGSGVSTLILMTTASLGSVKGTPGFNHGVQVEFVAEVEKLLAQPTQLGLDWDSDGQCQVQHGGTGMLSHIGKAEHLIDIDLQVLEERTQLGD